MYVFFVFYCFFLFFLDECGDGGGDGGGERKVTNISYPQKLWMTVAQSLFILIFVCFNFVLRSSI